MQNSDSKNVYHVIGLMSGTSLDGLDIAHCIIQHNNGTWKFEISHANTISYPQEWVKRLKKAPRASGIELTHIHIALGEWMGHEVKKFIVHNHLTPDFISSHGHTIYHDPSQQITLQIGSGASMAAAAHLPVVCDFRSMDVAMGGQGAPLVPAGDRALFAQYGACLNLGGIANISYMDAYNITHAYDICPVNMILNYLAAILGYEYDSDGAMASKGRVIQELLHTLNELPYYHLQPPKSLGREWFESIYLPHFQSYNTHDMMATAVAHIAEQIGNASKILLTNTQIYVTGGGAFNTFLISQIREKISSNISLTIPDQKIIKFKEALIFAWLGVMRWRGEHNVLGSVTGALSNHSAGCIYII
ncbi:MAG: anhydro-N-acetylmuramic acid kinase [Cytophagales bacterium]|nr:anhydro-N-acetylmuramic acid kinase [Cytophagales bacterium]